MPPISVLIKPSSGMCNMKCDYCFYCDEMKKRMRESYGFMTEQTLKNVIRKTMFHAEGMISYAYQGCLLYTSSQEFLRRHLILYRNKKNLGCQKYNFV